MKGGINVKNFCLRSYIQFNNFYFDRKVPYYKSLIITIRRSPTLFYPYFVPFVCAGLLATWVPLSLRLLVNYLFILIFLFILLVITDYISWSVSILLIMRKVTTQVLIAGCGPVGLTLANCLVKSPYIDSIALLDRKIPK